MAWADPVNPFVNLSYGFTLGTDALFESFSDSQTNVSALGNGFSLVENPGIGPGPIVAAAPCSAGPHNMDNFIPLPRFLALEIPWVSTQEWVRESPL